ncbi:sugar kinase [Pseudomonas syringae]|uniref:PfkB family carbohydrate kinase n=1 Tax=Pseudomonas syringae TaxID=317 RepID=UPI001F2D3755|nr:PfkB family carbohydrate kinase [Pseudomonas syringae]MCF5179843.1 sugar kinase [Pseudomonas syringae]MCF5316105.1 sugar kinase [Pseudomonas syringae]MCF5361829.1 sugar kinase [Pseudomonas syringae]MCF5391372.1 sugar kinase [Pseudomonas syringae]MCF5395534.1 sugar kinase [Pseudomonas syringae]
MPAKLFYTGQVVVDLVMAIDRLPPSGGDVLATSATFEAGGGFNVMAAACRNGLRTVYLGRHGQGRFGDIARQAMRDEGVEISTMPREDTGLAVALVEASAERSFISYVGAEGGLSAEDLHGVQVSAEDYVFVSGYSLAHKNKVTALLAWLGGLPSGTAVVFDPGPLVDALYGVEMRAVLPLISLWSSNREEALRFTQTQTPADALHSLASTLREDALIVMRDGPAGCWIHHAGQTRLIPGFAVTALDTNGAGDAHAGVLLAELARGSSVDRAALRANAAAAIAVTRRGPATAPGREEIDALVGADV